MIYLKQNQKLDAVLKYLKDNPDGEMPTKYILDTLESTYPGNFGNADIASLLKQLHRDRHITTTPPGLHKITFEGVVFLDNGGYTNERRMNYIRRRYIKSAHRSGNQTATLMPWFLALLVLTAVCYLLKYGYDHWNWQIPF